MVIALSTLKLHPLVFLVVCYRLHELKWSLNDILVLDVRLLMIKVCNKCHLLPILCLLLQLHRIGTLTRHLVIDITIFWNYLSLFSLVLLGTFIFGILNCFRTLLLNASLILLHTHFTRLWCFYGVRLPTRLGRFSYTIRLIDFAVQNFTASLKI